MSHYDTQPILMHERHEAGVFEVATNVALTMFAMYALLLQLSQDGVGMVFFFTLWNNVTMVLAPLLKNTKFARIPLAFAIMTMTIYSVFELYSHLTGSMDYVWFEARNILGHYVGPFLVVFIYYKERITLPKAKWTDIATILMYYSTVMLNVFVLKNKLPLTDEIYPYFFMDTSKYPVWLTIGIMVAFVAYFTLINVLITTRKGSHDVRKVTI